MPVRQCSGSGHCQFGEQQSGKGHALDTELLASWNVVQTCQHLAGVENKVADVLSCSDLPSFQVPVPGARREPTVIPEPLLAGLVMEQPD